MKLKSESTRSAGSFLRYSFTPSKIAKKLCYYIPICGYAICTHLYYKKRDYYPMQLVMCIKKGTMQCEHKGRSFVAKAGDVVLMDCEEFHYYRGRDGLEFSYIHYTGLNAREITQYLLDTYGPLICTPGNTRVMEYVEDTINFGIEKDDPDFFEVSKKVYDLLWLLHDVCSKANAEDRIVRKAIDYIKENYQKRLTVDEIAEYVHLSPYYFSHKFKKETKYSPVEYVVKMRLDRAKNLLIQTDKSIEEIASEVGYNNSNSFGNIFNNKVGCSPYNYRKRMR